MTMKIPYYLLLGGATILLNSCGALKSVQQPLNSNGSFDPLNAPGNQSQSSDSSSFSAPTSASYTPGQWVETSMPNSTFFRVIPKGNATADKVLQAGVPLKFISSQGSYTKVELDSGQVGFIPEIMVIERSAATVFDAGAVAPPLPFVDGTVPGTDPFVPPGVLPPAPGDPSSVLPDIPTIPNEAPVVPSAPELPGVPEIPAPSSITLPDVPTPAPIEIPAPPAVNGITEPSTTD